MSTHTGAAAALAGLPPTHPAHAAVPPHAAVRPPGGGNQLLAGLPADLQQRLIALASRVELPKAAVLVEAGTPLTHVHFPCSGLLSLQTTTADGNTAEVVMVGRDGIDALPCIAFKDVGAPAAYTTVVTAPGAAMRLPADALRAECELSAPLRRALMRQWHAMMSDIGSGSACHRFHTARQRLARWLLAASDRLQSSRIEMTQDELGQILGLRRTVVTVAKMALQNTGALSSRHGCLRIVDRAQLQRASCGCCVRGAERAHGA